MNVFPDALNLKDAGMRGDVRLFQLTALFRYISSYGIIIVPAWFITDGASIPRIFWSLFDPFGIWFYAAIIHDYLYSPNNKKFSRKQSDLIFKEAMYNVGVPWHKRETIYRMVRMFGSKHYRGKIK